MPVMFTGCALLAAFHGRQVQPLVLAQSTASIAMDAAIAHTIAHFHTCFSLVRCPLQLQVLGNCNGKDLQLMQGEARHLPWTVFYSHGCFDSTYHRTLPHLLFLLAVPLEASHGKQVHSQYSVGTKTRKSLRAG